MDDEISQTSHPVPTKRRTRHIPMWVRIVLYALPVIGVGVAMYVLISPQIIAKFYPQYGVMAKYSNVMTCTDTPADAAGTYTPMCSAVATSTTSHMIGCIYRNPSTYTPPAQSTDDQRLVCPKLMSTTMPDGQSAPGLTRFATTEPALRINYSLIVTGIFTGVYMLVILIVVLSKRRRRTAINI
jgi:hypothetical protein